MAEVTQAAPSSTMEASKEQETKVEAARSSSKPATSYSMDPILYLYTSLTAGSSHIITATSRMETILKANKIPFKGMDIATDEKARMLWSRRAGKDASGRARKIPGLVQMGMVIGDIVEVEDWNEYGELRQHVKIVPLNKDGTVAPKKTTTTKKVATKKVDASTSRTKSGLDKPDVGPADAAAVPMETITPMRSIAEEAAQKAKDLKKLPTRSKVVTPASAPIKPDIFAATFMQSSTSTWSIEVGPHKATEQFTESASTPAGSRATRRSIMFEPSKKEVQIEDVVASFGSLASMQSPNSTAWRPFDMAVMGNLSKPFDTKENLLELKEPVASAKSEVESESAAAHTKAQDGSHLSEQDTTIL